MRTSLLLTALCTSLWLASCDPGVQAYTAEGKIYRGATSAERLEQALAGAGSPRISFDGSETLTQLLKEEGARLLVDAPARVKGLPESVTAEALLDDPAVREAFWANDEPALAKLLLEKNVRAVVLHTEIGPSLDRGASVAARLYQHDALDYFRLVRIGDGLLYYTISPTPAVFPPQLAAMSIQYIRQRLAGAPIMRLQDVQSPTGAWSLAAVLRGQGHELAISFSRHKTLQGALEELIRDLERKHRRDVELLGFPPLKRHITEGLSVELHYIYERAYVEPRDEATLEQLWEMGVDGAYLVRELKDGDSTRVEKAALPGAVSYTKSIRTADAFLREAAAQGQMSEKRPWRDAEAWLEMFRSIHFRLDDQSRLSILYRGTPLIPMQAVTLASVRDGILAAGEWYLANLQPSGEVTYKFWPSENRYSNEYNLVRHTLATWNLVQAYNLDPRPEFLEGSKRALAFTDRFLKFEDVQEACGKVEWCEPGRLDVSGQMAFYSYNNNQKLGTVVVNMLGLIDLARATGSHEWDEQLRAMGRFTKFMQRADGTFQGYYVDKDHPYYTFVNDIVPGEAALALITLAEYLDEDEWISGLPAYWAYYRPWFKERAEKGDRTAPWPALTYDNNTRLELVQFGPWTVMAANAYHRRTGDEDVARFGLEIARWMIDSYEWTAEKTPFPDYVGGYYKLAGELPAMQAFCYAEGTAAAYNLALRMAPDERAYFEKATRETMRFALQMQYNEGGLYAFSRPEELQGGIRYAMNETKVRIDYVYHAQSSMYQWYTAALNDTALPETVRLGPPIPGQLRATAPTLPDADPNAEVVVRSEGEPEGRSSSTPAGEGESDE